MTNFDKLLAQLRDKTAKKTKGVSFLNDKKDDSLDFFSLQNTKKIKKHVSTLDDNILESNTIHNTNYTNNEETHHDNHSVQKSTFYSSSQPDRIINTQDVTIKADYNKLKNVKGNKNSIKQILESKEMFFEDKLYVMLFHVYVNEFFMVKIEFSDDTGTISGTMPYELYNTKKYKIGDVFELQDFAVWRENDVYLVLVEKSILCTHR
ncbi:hypothetical protein BDAP_002006 [Binucleata daphniae]